MQKRHKMSPLEIWRAVGAHHTSPQPMARGRQEQDTVYAFVSAQVCWDGKDPPVPPGPDGHCWLHYMEHRSQLDWLHHQPMQVREKRKRENLHLSWAHLGKRWLRDRGLHDPLARVQLGPSNVLLCLSVLECQNTEVSGLTTPAETGAVKN